jgi:hypothetical protein
MTFWDHETGSIWSQPTGRAIEGVLKGVELFLLPSTLTTWSSWLEKHPQSQLMTNNLYQIPRWSQRFDPKFVIGLVLGDEARAYYYDDVAAQGIINDDLGPTPLLVWADDTEIVVFSRQVDQGSLTFLYEENLLTDLETGSTWDPARGLAIDGPLQGTALRQLPTLSSFDWAWADFYPHSGFYNPKE